MEEEKLHEAAGQPGTEVLAGEEPAPEVSAVLPEGETAGTVEAEASTERAEVPVPEGEIEKDVPSEEGADSADEKPQADQEPGEDPEDAPLHDGRGSVSEDVPEPESDETAGADEELVDDTPVPDADGGTDADDEGPRNDQEPAEVAEEPPLPDGRGSVSEDGSGAEDGSVSDGPDSDPETSINAFELLGSTEDQATEAETDAATLKAVLEAIVYVLPEPVPAAQMAAALNQPVERVESILRELMDDTAQADRGVFVREVAGGYQVATKPEHHEAIRNFVKNLKQPLKLSGAALETLAVIAYKQPVTAPEIMEIRGVQGVGVLKTLLDRKLITTAGRKNVVGKPILYKTTKEFLTQFGLNRLSELPTLKEFEEIRRQSISDDEVEERPEADPSAPLAEQAAQLKLDGASEPEAEPHAGAGVADEGDPQPEAAREASPAGTDAPAGAESEAAPHAAAEPAAEADPQPEAPPAPETGPESEENHG